MARRRSRQLGLTLIEVMVAMGLSTLVLAGVTGVYYFALSQWNTGAAQTDAFVSASQAADRLGAEITRGRYADVSVKSDWREVLKIGVLPAGTDLGGADYFPESSDAGYDLGDCDEYWYYLSDSTGDIDVAGDILWRAYKPVDGSATPDTAWTFYEGTTEPRISGVTYLDFFSMSFWNTVRVAINIKGTESQEEETQSIVCWVYQRNHD